jgi:hypothetical protein
MTNGSEHVSARVYKVTFDLPLTQSERLVLTQAAMYVSGLQAARQMRKTRKPAKRRKE